MTWSFANLQMFGYSVIVADPPWRYERWSENGQKKGAAEQYDTMAIEQIRDLPVGQLAGGDCLLLLWACGCMLPEALGVMGAWGFRFKSEMAWRKVFPSGAVRMGTGYRVRTMHEPILVGTIGHPQHKAFPSLFDGIAREHSRKPDEFYRIVRGCTPLARRCDPTAGETSTASSTTSPIRETATL